MSSTVVEISSTNFSGQTVNILFAPTDSNQVYGLGSHVIPYTFTSTTISNSLEVYGTYTIVSSANCVTFLVIPNPTPTPTITVTPTITPTITPTLTPTPTPSYDPCKVPSSTPTYTPTLTPTSTPSVTPSVTQTINPCLYTETPTPTYTPTPTSTPLVYICFNYNSTGTTYNELLQQTGILNGYPYYTLTIGYVWAGITGVWYWTRQLGSTVLSTLTNNLSYPNTISTDWVNVNSSLDNMYSTNYQICVPTPTPTPTPTLTPTTTPTNTLTPTVTTTTTQTITPTHTPTNSVTPTNTVTPTVTPSPPPSLGGSLYFDGVSAQYLSIPANSNFDVNSNDFTLEWFEKDPDDTNDNTRIISFGTYPAAFGVSIEGASHIMRIWANNGQILNYEFNDLGTTWHHIALVKYNNNVTIYFDGASASTTNYSTPINNSGLDLIIGIDTAYSAITQYKGNLTNMRFVNGTALYTGATYTVPTTQLSNITNTVLLLNAASPLTYITDSSSLSNTVTNVNGVTWSSETPFI